MSGHCDRCLPIFACVTSWWLARFNLTMRHQTENRITVAFHSMTLSCPFMHTIDWQLDPDRVTYKAISECVTQYSVRNLKTFSVYRQAAWTTRGTKWSSLTGNRSLFINSSERINFSSLSCCHPRAYHRRSKLSTIWTEILPYTVKVRAYE